MRPVPRASVSGTNSRLECEPSQLLYTRANTDAAAPSADERVARRVHVGVAPGTPAERPPMHLECVGQLASDARCHAHIGSTRMSAGCAGEQCKCGRHQGCERPSAAANASAARAPHLDPGGTAESQRGVDLARAQQRLHPDRVQLIPLETVSRRQRVSCTCTSPRPGRHCRVAARRRSRPCAATSTPRPGTAHPTGTRCGSRGRRPVARRCAPP